MSKGKSRSKKNAPLQSLEPQNAEKVKAGVAFSPLIASRIATQTVGGNSGGDTGGGKSDPAQMFQQIMQQLTHGQG